MLHTSASEQHRLWDHKLIPPPHLEDQAINTIQILCFSIPVMFIKCHLLFCCRILWKNYVKKKYKDQFRWDIISGHNHCSEFCAICRLVQTLQCFAVYSLQTWNKIWGNTLEWLCIFVCPSVRLSKFCPDTVVSWGRAGGLRVFRSSSIPVFDLSVNDE